MITWTVGYRYTRRNRVERAHTFVQADSAHEARGAFEATHPAGSTFRYDVTYVEHPEA